MDNQPETPETACTGDRRTPERHTGQTVQRRTDQTVLGMAGLNRRDRRVRDGRPESQRHQEPDSLL